MKAEDYYVKERGDGEANTLDQHADTGRGAAGESAGWSAGDHGLEVGEKAPDFTLPSTIGGQISLSQFQGKQVVLIEFYGVDFAPT